MFRWFKKSQSRQEDRRPEREAAGVHVAGELPARAETEGRADPMPAWALRFRSPYERSQRVSSWLGGAPQVPGDFNWPNDVDGTPLHFLAQIDLASLKPEPKTGMRPPGLPDEGALLVFVGQSYACHVLSASDMDRAAPATLPDGLAPVRKHGFFSDERTFTYWPIDPMAYLDAGGERPAFLPDKFERPADWITNWGIAGLEAEIAIDCLEMELSHGGRFEETWSRQRKLGGALAGNKVIRSKIEHYALMKRKAPDLIAALGAWRRSALSESQEDRVDEARLEEIFRLRIALCNEMQSYRPKFILPGNANEVWERICRDYPQLGKASGYNALPAAYRSFVEARITGWRGHRLFGIEPPFPNNFEDFRGQGCLISIAADRLLGAESEHEYGMSVWCSRDSMAKAQYGEGQFVRHCAV